MVDALEKVTVRRRMTLSAWDRVQINEVRGSTNVDYGQENNFTLLSVSQQPPMSA